MRPRAPREAAVRTPGGHGGCVVGVVGVIAVAAAAAGITAGGVVGIVIIAALCGGLSLSGADGRAAQRLRQSFLLLKVSAGNSLDVRAPQVGNGLCDKLACTPGSPEAVTRKVSNDDRELVTEQLL